jgi:hypothetical protein
MSDGNGSTARGRLTFFGPEGVDDLPGALEQMVACVEFPAGIGERFGPAFGLGLEARPLFLEGGVDGMSLLVMVLEPDCIIVRHVHDIACLYVVLSGEAVLGSRVVGPGGGFFVPAGQPYGYRAGPQGARVLEFRSTSRFRIDVLEDSPKRWQEAIENAQQHVGVWSEPALAPLAVLAPDA